MYVYVFMYIYIYIHIGSVPPPIIVPSGPRVSDWCFVGSFDSDPPTVKTNTVYDIIRLLGRGAFGDVNLVKNVDDNRYIYIHRCIYLDEYVYVHVCA
jgi:hypothetical protein